MFNVSYLALAAFGFALVVTLVLAACLTPSHWWRRLNARALAIVGLGTWGIGTLVLWLAQSQATAPLMAAGSMKMASAPLSVSAPAAGRSYRVHEALNLRAGKGTAAPRIAVVPAGSVVTTTGAGDGDWWQVKTTVGDQEVRGWSSSLWLRRSDEAPL